MTLQVYDLSAFCCILSEIEISHAGTGCDNALSRLRNSCRFSTLYISELLSRGGFILLVLAFDSIFSSLTIDRYIGCSLCESLVIGLFCGSNTIFSTAHDSLNTGSLTVAVAYRLLRLGKYSLRVSPLGRVLIIAAIVPVLILLPLSLDI